MLRALSMLVAAMLVFASPAHAQCERGSGKRAVALLVGISDYRAPENGPDEGSAPLANAVHDVETVCDELRRAGFKLFVSHNPDQYPALYKVAPGKFYLVERPKKLELPSLESLATVDEPELAERPELYRLTKELADRKGHPSGAVAAAS